jgi:copper chaperone
MTTFKVDDMRCGHCTTSIEKAIHVVDPGAKVACDLGAKEVTVDGALDAEALASAIRDAGFEPRAV